MILPVYTYNHPVLKQRTAQIDDMSDELRDLIRDMFETMYKANGIGLAANQVGKGLSLTVIDISDRDEGEDPGQIVLINPVIEAFSDDEEEFEEGCLSLPDYRDTVIRPSAIQVRYLDASMTERVMEADGLVARVMQHEIDHLNGIYFFERLSPIRRTLGSGKLKKIARGQFEADYPTFPQSE
ncbi:MAG: peptide deformylase [Candidatus Kapabacteria bacterium]|nr:peptide deformylase [Candidatus Kapabacteria bacterium]